MTRPVAYPFFTETRKTNAGVELQLDVTEFRGFYSYTIESLSGDRPDWAKQPSYGNRLLGVTSHDEAKTKALAAFNKCIDGLNGVVVE